MNNFQKLGKQVIRHVIGGETVEEAARKLGIGIKVAYESIKALDGTIEYEAYKKITNKRKNIKEKEMKFRTIKDIVQTISDGDIICDETKRKSLLQLKKQLEEEFKNCKDEKKKSAYRFMINLTTRLANITPEIMETISQYTIKYGDVASEKELAEVITSETKIKASILEIQMSKNKNNIEIASKDRIERKIQYAYNLINQNEKEHQI